jgi:hypothetical protein
VVLFFSSRFGNVIKSKICNMYYYLIIIALATILVYLSQFLVNLKFAEYKPTLSSNEINSLLSKRMHVIESTKKAYEIDRVLLRHGYSFVTPITLAQKGNGCTYTFNELASNGKRRTAWRLCKTIKAMNIDGIEDVRIPKPGFCTVYTKQNVSYSSLQKVFTLLGVYQCDIKEKSSAILSEA